MKKFTLTLTALWLAACASAPKEPSAQATGAWKDIGAIHQGNITIAYDTGSLNIQGNKATLRERKIVQQPKNENYLNLPEFKTAVGEWEFQCKQRTYRLIKMDFWDNHGKIIAQHNYLPGEVPAAAIVPNTPTEKLFAIACTTNPPREK